MSGADAFEGCGDQVTRKHVNEGAYKVLSPLVKDNASQLVGLCIEHGPEQTAELLQKLDDTSAARLLERIPRGSVA